MTSPITTIEKFTGKILNLPQGKTIVVRDQTDEFAVYINFPAMTNIDNMELNEEQLEAVAGGMSPMEDFLFYLCRAFNL